VNRRSSWIFSTIEEFFAIVSIPELPQNTRSISFEQLTDGFGFVIDSLATFAALTDLLFDFSSTPYTTEIDLDAIVESCPLLEKIDFVWVATHCGTLASAAHLKELNPDNHPELETVLSPSLLPIDSAHTLESFKLWEGENYIHNVTPDEFDRFTNLNHLEIECLTPTSVFWDILKLGKFKLTTRKLRYSEKRGVGIFADVSGVFATPSLKFLRDLVFISFGGSINDELISAITNLPDLETLESVICCTSSFERFANLRHLKSVLFELDVLSLTTTMVKLGKAVNSNCSSQQKAYEMPPIDSDSDSDVPLEEEIQHVAHLVRPSRRQIAKSIGNSILYLPTAPNVHVLL
jgi:hypothetical protein